MENELTEAQALDTLRQLRGVRDALMGFNPILDKLSPVIKMIENAKQAVVEAEGRKARIAADIVELEKKQHGYKTLEQKAKRALDDETALIETKRRKVQSDLREAETALENMKHETKEKLVEGQTKVAELNKTIVAKEARIHELEKEFSKFKQAHGF